MRLIILLLAVAALAACGHSGDAEWPTHGHDSMAQRYAPLEQIGAANVGKLGLAWYHDLDTDRGQEATPIMVGRTLYTISAYDVVVALDAVSGKVKWRFDPQVREASARSCCGPVSRGVAVSDGRVFVGALDGRLIALDAKNGNVLWQVDTLDAPDTQKINYTITGAPRVVKGKVLIGNGGAEFGVRGYVSAYDAKDGKLAWRFYTVPGKPGTEDNAASDKALAKAAPSWSGEWWRWGGGGTVWDAIEYDPALDLIYIGTGNASPWNIGLRSAGKGDNLFVSSIIALRPDSGEYVWHFQSTPGDSWDYTATQNIVLADLKLGGRVRKVMMQAPKNGFFYVLDRETGAFISATPFVQQNWARGIDPVSGRPEIEPAARYWETGKPHFQFPSSGGGHNWPPMAFSPQTGLAYIPAQDVGMPFAPQADERPVPGIYSSGVALSGGGQMDAKARQQLYAGMKGWLIAWDPVRRKAAWKVPMAAPFNGGVLATSGGLVFAGDLSKHLAAYDAQSGKLLWNFDAKTAVMAPPITYAIAGEQYVAVMAGWGGGWPLTGGVMALQAGDAKGPNRLLVFKLGGAAKLPDTRRAAQTRATPPPDAVSAAAVALGDRLYGRNCLRCHGSGAVSAGAYPDLRWTPMLAGKGLKPVVLDGALKAQGMPGFADTLSEKELAAIRAYLIQRAREDQAKGL